MTSIAVVTVYHFGDSDQDSYSRLLRNVRSSLKQLKPCDTLVLVANGTNDGAAHPDRVLADAAADNADRVFPVIVESNMKAAGGLNIGVNAALRCPFDWLATVQSSVVLSPQWIQNMRTAVNAERHSDGFRGRITYEDQPYAVWSDGHYLSEGKTFDTNHDKSTVEPLDQPKEDWTFPCLSAALYSRGLVKSIMNQYGNFLTVNIPHYGDCTDVGLRSARLGYRHFPYVYNAIASKRRPMLKLGAIACSQLLAAHRYYRDGDKDRLVHAISRLSSRTSTMRYIDGALAQFKALSALEYSPKGQEPPQATEMEDRAWGLPKQQKSV